jgi:hypothetical protein
LRIAGGELGVDALGFGELVFQDDDAAGGLQRVALVDQLAGAGGEAQLVAGVAAVPAGRALRLDQPGFAQAPQESLGVFGSLWAFWGPGGPGGDRGVLRGIAHRTFRIKRAPVP